MRPQLETDPYKRPWFPAEMISHGGWLYCRFGLSDRDVEELRAARGMILTYEAIRQWCRKFGQAYANQLRHRRLRPGDKWHLALCQTPPIHLSWRPLRLCEQALRDRRGGGKREPTMDVTCVCRDDACLAQARRAGLPCCPRALAQRIPQ